jgi:hypothetical protein
VTDLPVTDVSIEDEFQIYQFRGQQIGTISTRMDPRDRQRARWMELELFRKDDGSYVLAQRNDSIVWHLPQGIDHVKKPDTIRSFLLPEDAVYCGVMPVRENRGHCPLMSIRDSRQMKLPPEVITELPQFKVWVVPDVATLIERMTVAPHASDGSSSSAVSWPMRQLLNQAALVDPAFAVAARDKPVIKL